MPSKDRSTDAVIVGAGLAGLACARELRAAGFHPVVLERSAGVGGRCATRRVEGQPVDHGAAFIHGADAGFIGEVEAVDSPALAGWPGRILGAGSPCQPEAFAPQQRRWAFRLGMTVFPKHLAQGLDIRLRTRVLEFSASAGGFEIRTESSGVLRAGSLVLAAALEQSRELLEGVKHPNEETRGVMELLGMFSTTPCLTLLAGYSAATQPAPSWDICYPEESDALQLISHDSTKRAGAEAICLVFQARPVWSRRHLEDPPASWSAAILSEAERLLGGWVAAPRWTQAHVWRRARLEPGDELAAPVLLEMGGGARLGLAGEIFSPGGGLEGAWRSGRALARRMILDGGGR